MPAFKYSPTTFSPMDALGSGDDFDTNMDFTEHTITVTSPYNFNVIKSPHQMPTWNSTGLETMLISSVDGQSDLKVGDYIMTVDGQNTSYVDFVAKRNDSRSMQLFIRRPPGTDCDAATLRKKELLRSVTERVTSWIDEHASPTPGSTTKIPLAITHGGIIRAMCNAVKPEAHGYKKFKPPNLGMYGFVQTADGASIYQLADKKIAVASCAEKRYDEQNPGTSCHSYAKRPSTAGGHYTQCHNPPPQLLQTRDGVACKDTGILHRYPKLSAQQVHDDVTDTVRIHPVLSAQQGDGAHVYDDMDDDDDDDEWDDVPLGDESAVVVPEAPFEYISFSDFYGIRGGIIKFIAIRHIKSTNNRVSEPHSVGDAVAALPTAIMHPTDPKIHITLATILQVIGEFGQSIGNISHALDMLTFHVSPMVRTLQTFALIYASFYLNGQRQQPSETTPEKYLLPLVSRVDDSWQIDNRLIERRKSMSDDLDDTTHRVERIGEIVNDMNTFIKTTKEKSTPDQSTMIADFEALADAVKILANAYQDETKHTAQSTIANKTLLHALRITPQQRDEFRRGLNEKERAQSYEEHVRILLRRC